MSTFLLTHAEQYTGPGTLAVLLRQGHTVLCHDKGFIDADARRRFERSHPGAVALPAQSPDELVERALSHGAIDGLISNDVHPNRPTSVEDIPLEALRESFEALVAFPFRLGQRVLSAMKRQGGGAMVFVTSARELQPEPGFALATTLRAGTTGFAKALAREAAPHGVSVNVVAPNYLYSEMYYPRARFVDDPQGRAEIAGRVPFGRLGEPEEVGELIAFMASGKSAFTTGQVIYFTGGWP